MRLHHFIPIGFVFLYSSCQLSEEDKLEVTEIAKKQPIIVGDFDTSSVLQKLNLKESGSSMDLINEDIPSLSNRIDTLELTYYFGFCDCQRWVLSEVFNDATKQNPKVDEYDPRGQVEFNLQKHGFYIEAPTKDMMIDWRTEVNGTTIRFIGREYADLRLPMDKSFTVPDPPKGKVFRYYNYQVLKPYKAWGPRKLTEIDQETRDSITEPTILTVR